MTQRMVVAAAPCALALTLQTISLFSADSRLPRSTMVTRNFSRLTGCRIRSGRVPWPRVRKYQPPRLAPPATSRAASANSHLLRFLHRPLLDGSRLGTGLGEEFGLG